MEPTQNNVTREREVASALLELRAVFTRCRLLLPSLPLDELINLSGVVEQAVTLSMRKHQRKETKTVDLTTSSPKDSISLIEVKTKRGPISVIQGKNRVPVPDAVEEILKKEGPLTSPMILAGMNARGWRLFTMQKSQVSAIRRVVEMEPKRFLRSGKGKKTIYRIASSTKPGVKKASSSKSPGDKSNIRVDVLRALAKREEPISTPDLCKIVGVTNGQTMSPLLNSLRDFGAIKKSKKDDVLYWTPVKDKLKEYDTARGGKAFSNGHSNLIQAQA